MNGAHVPVLLEETVARVSGGEGVYVDATFGRGGHTRRLLEVLGPTSIVVAIDRDPSALPAGTALGAADGRLRLCHGNFAELDRILDGLGFDRVEGVMMDLGVSSAQIDEPGRGFSYRFDAPLDMRMDTTQGQTAADWLNAAARDDIARVLREYGEERYARRIAAAIVAARPLATTGQLAEVVRSAQPRATPGKHDATRVFQAVRIQINAELESLETGLTAAFGRLAGGGRLAVISFHSLEDRIVKHYFRSLTTPAPLPRRLPVRGDQGRPPARLVGAPVTAGADEIRANPRARSARLRVVERVVDAVAGESA